MSEIQERRVLQPLPEHLTIEGYRARQEQREQIRGDAVEPQHMPNVDANHLVANTRKFCAQHLGAFREGGVLVRVSPTLTPTTANATDNGEPTAAMVNSPTRLISATRKIIAGMGLKPRVA